MLPLQQIHIRKVDDGRSVRFCWIMCSFSQRWQQADPSFNASTARSQLPSFAWPVDYARPRVQDWPLEKSSLRKDMSASQSSFYCRTIAEPGLIARFVRKSLQVAATAGCACASAQTYTVKSPSEALQYVKAASAQTSTAVEASLASSLPVLVLIPGILGSKLQWSDYTFGVDRVDGKHLVFDPQLKPKATVLDTYQISSLNGTVARTFSRQDVYGTSLDQLRELSGGRFALEFAYDWRDDIDQSARALQEWLKTGPAKDRDVAFIAHSMGGLVLWRWFQLFQPQQRPVKPKISMFVGSPIQGTCEAAKMLIQGYRAPSGSSLLEELGTQVLFEDARGALFTFPSIFQLLPAYSRNKACLTIAGNKQDHHEPEFWLGRNDRPGGLLAYNGRRLREYADSVGLSQDLYQSRVRAAIAAGKRFRDSIRFEPPKDVQAVFLYSDTSKMDVEHAIRVDAKGWYELQAAEGRARGDGRVLEGSARNDGYGRHLYNSRHSLSNAHGDLVRDPGLIKYIRDNVLAQYEAVQTKVLAEFLQSSSIARNAILTSKFIVDPAVRASGYDLTRAQMVIANLNADIVAPGVSNKGQALAAFSSSFFDQAPSALRAALIESAIVSDEYKTQSDAFSKLVSYRAATGDFSKVFHVAGRLSETADTQTQQHRVWATLEGQGIVEIQKDSEPQPVYPMSAKLITETKPPPKKSLTSHQRFLRNVKRLKF